MDKTILLAALNERELAKAKSKEYYNEHKTIILAKKKLYRDKVKADKKKSNENNKETIKARKTQWSKDNVEHIKEYGKEYREINSKKIKTYAKEYRKTNLSKIREHNKKIRNTNPLIKLIDNTRRNLRYGFTSNGFKKNNKTVDILGCSFDEFKIYLESKFESWMTWDNYGNPKDGICELNKTWDIDHIEPISNAKTIADVIRLNHHTNLQPLCSYTNRFIKRNLHG